MDSYPYFVFPLVRQYDSLEPSDPAREQLELLIAANVGQQDALLALIGDKRAGFRDFYPERPRITTEDTINTFIAKFGPQHAEAPDLPVSPASSLMEESSASSEEIPGGESRSESVSMSLDKVKFLVKNRKYQEALEIMEAIYLNNPKKSVYFADQIRYVKKLMLNESKK